MRHAIAAITLIASTASAQEGHHEVRFAFLFGGERVEMDGERVSPPESFPTTFILGAMVEGEFNKEDSRLAAFGWSVEGNVLLPVSNPSRPEFRFFLGPTATRTLGPRRTKVSLRLAPTYGIVPAYLPDDKLKHQLGGALTVNVFLNSHSALSLTYGGGGELTDGEPRRGYLLTSVEFILFTN